MNPQMHFLSFYFLIIELITYSNIEHGGINSYGIKISCLLFNSVPTLFVVSVPDKGNSIPFLRSGYDCRPLFIANRFPNVKCLCMYLEARDYDPLNAI